MPRFPLHRTMGPLGVTTKVASSWWLAGGISASNCVLAYQPKGAASYAASKSNLANPGTYTATEGAAPSWATGTGWSSTGSAWLNTGILPPRSGAYTMIIRYSDLPASGNNIRFNGSRNGAGNQSFFIEANVTNGTMGYINGTSGTGSLTTSPGPRSGVIALAGGNGYIDGVFKGGWTISNSSDPTRSIYLLAMNNAGTPTSATVTIQAAAIYNAVLDATTISALTTAMNAL